MISPIPTAKIKSQNVDKIKTINMIKTSELNFMGPSAISFGKIGIALSPLNS